MIIQDFFIKLPEELKDEFVKQLTNMALLIELNKAEFDVYLKRLINSTATPLKLKRMYRFFLKLDWNDRERFFNAFYVND